MVTARQLAGRDGIVLVCGSLYLVGEVIALQRRDAVAVG
jgi:folylpolyglutamate synthase/dihydropteroate synthase